MTEVLGINLALPPAQVFVAGTRQVIIVTFAANSGEVVRDDTIEFTDLPIAREIVNVDGNPIPAIYLPNVGDRSSRSVVTVSAANYEGVDLAIESLAASFGTALAATTQEAETNPLPTSLAGTQVLIRDSAGIERLAPLILVSPSQINYQIPPETAPGMATVIISNPIGDMVTGTVQIQAVAPGLFSAGVNGQGLSQPTCCM